MDNPLSSGQSPSLLGTYRDTDPLGLRIRQSAVRMFRDSLDQALDRVDRSLREDLKRVQGATRSSEGGDQSRLEHLRSLLGAGRREAMLLLDNLLGEHADPTVWPDDLATETRPERVPVEMPGAQWSSVQSAALSAMDVVSRGLVDTLGISVDRVQKDNMRAFMAAWTAFGQDQERRVRMGRSGTGRTFRPEDRAATNPFDVTFFGRVIYLAHAAVGLITRNGADPYHVAVMTHLTDTVSRALTSSLRESTVLLVDAGFGVQRAPAGAVGQVGADLLSEGSSAAGGIAAEIMAAGMGSVRFDGQRRPSVVPQHQAQSDDTELFGSLCNLLSTWEPTEEEVAQVTRIAEEGIGLPMPALTPDETTSVISVLQTMVPPGLAEALGLGRGRIATEIKSAMRDQARKQGITADLGQKDSSAVDLVDEVVDTTLVNRRLQNAARAIMARILFPSVKAAMKDQSGFAADNNPARDFIGAMAEAVAPRGAAPRKETLDKASAMVDNLVANFHEDLSIFTELTQEIRQHLEKAKLASAGERGERRDDWRARLQERWANAVVAEPVRAFAVALGAEHLSLQEDRGVGGGLQEHDCLQALDSLIRATSSARQRVRIDGVWRQNLLDMLASCGWHGVRAHSLLAEQEDLIHAFHVLGRTTFDDKSVAERLLHPQEEDSSEPILSGGSLRNQASRDQASRDQASRDQASRDQAARDQAGKNHDVQNHDVQGRRDNGRAETGPAELRTPEYGSDSHILQNAQRSRPSASNGPRTETVSRPASSNAIPSGAGPSSSTNSEASSSIRSGGGNRARGSERASVLPPELPQHTPGPADNSLTGTAKKGVVEGKSGDLRQDRLQQDRLQQGQTETDETIGNTVLARQSDPVETPRAGDVRTDRSPERAVNERAVHSGSESTEQNQSREAPGHHSANVVSIRRSEEGKNGRATSGENGASEAETQTAQVKKNQAGDKGAEGRDAKLQEAKPQEPRTMDIVAPEAQAVVASNEPVLSDRELLDRITSLPVDSWSTFVVSPGRSALVRLSWVSPLSMKYLFVNEQGVRAVMGTANELFMLARQGRFFPGVGR